MLSIVMRNWGLKPFKVFDCWMQDGELFRSLEEVWKASPGFNLQVKLKNLRMKIRHWNMHVNGNLDQKIFMVKNEQFKLDEEGFPHDLKFNLSKKLYLDKSSMLSQKARRTR